ncbi:MAG: PAS domain-containing protein [Spirochaetaceae bacterium]|nr:MAG: PAS domain-containing protein [Spirochaetaceae bacterium]
MDGRLDAELRNRDPLVEPPGDPDCRGSRRGGARHCRFRSGAGCRACGSRRGDGARSAPGRKRGRGPVTIRRRIFLTYMVLILIVLFYLGLAALSQSARLGIETDLGAMLELRNTWSETHIALTDIVINWDNGTAYQRFRTRRTRFDRQLDETISRIAARRWYPQMLQLRLANLQDVWRTADRHLERVVAVVDQDEFREVEQRVQQMPGLQRLNHLWTELLEENSLAARRHAYLIQQLVTEVEFFPIYSRTVEGVFDAILAEARLVQSRIVILEQRVRVLFFGAFLLAWLLVSSRFALSISRPIKAVAHRLTDFIGQTGAAPSPAVREDEVGMLSETVDLLVDHYTDLADRAHVLARGEVASRAVRFPRAGIVGRSLDEIARYLNELAQTSAWIRDGEYGSQIRERSPDDVITRNFNIMSAVIHDKITTLRSMFDAVDEAVLVVDESRTVVETNARLAALLGWKGESVIPELLWWQPLVEQLDHLIAAAINRAEPPTAYLNVRGYRRADVPVRVETRVLQNSETHRLQVMFLISNESWRARAKRERERLRAQATLAELRALRAQINPHFFFNTLNTIAHLIETRPDHAVVTVEKLAQLFRYALDATNQEEVTLLEELTHIRRFLDIEQLRFPDRLTVDFRIDPDLEPRRVPAMLLQPLVENAVRYGADQDGCVRVEIRGRLDGDSMRVEVVDWGAADVDPERLMHGSGIGIRNVNHRLKTLYGRPLRFRRNRPHGVIAELRIPVTAGPVVTEGQ